MDLLERTSSQNLIKLIVDSTRYSMNRDVFVAEISQKWLAFKRDAQSQCSSSCIAVAIIIAVVLILLPIVCLLITLFHHKRLKRGPFVEEPLTTNRVASELTNVKRWQALHPPERRAYSYPVPLHHEESKESEIMDEGVQQRATVSTALSHIGAMMPLSSESSLSISMESNSIELEISKYADKKLKKSIRISNNPWTIDFKSMKKLPSIRSVQSSTPIFPRKESTMAYVEMTILTCDPQTVMSLGYSTKPYPPFRMPGTELYSIAYQSTDGHKFFNNPYDGDIYGPGYREGDVIGCGYMNLEGGLQAYFFTKNGEHLGNAITTTEMLGNSYLCVGADGPCKLVFNFGEKDFIYKNDVIAPLNVTEVKLPCLLCNELVSEDDIDQHMNAHTMEPQNNPLDSSVIRPSSNHQTISRTSSERRASTADVSTTLSSPPLLPSYEMVTKNQES